MILNRAGHRKVPGPVLLFTQARRTGREQLSQSSREAGSRPFFQPAPARCVGGGHVHSDIEDAQVDAHLYEQGNCAMMGSLA